VRRAASVSSDWALAGPAVVTSLGGVGADLLTGQGVDWTKLAVGLVLDLVLGFRAGRIVGHPLAKTTFTSELGDLGSSIVNSQAAIFVTVAVALLPLPQGLLPLALTEDGRHLAVSVEGRRLQVWNLPELRGELRKLGLDW
jgi:hypothetical protein